MITGEFLEFAIKKSGNNSIKNRKSSAFSGSLAGKHLEKSGDVTQLSKLIILDITKNIHLIGLSHERRVRTVLGANPKPC